MTPRIDTTPLVGEALNALRAATGLEGKAKPVPTGAREFVVAVKHKGTTWRFDATVRPWLTQAELGILKVEYAGRPALRRLLITRLVTPDHADQLRKMGLPFIDTHGNAFFDEKGLHVFVVGKGKGGGAGVPRGTLIQPGALKVLFAILCNPGLEGGTHQAIRDATGVGIGTINRLLQALEAERFLLKFKGGGRELHGRKELITTWTTAYPLRLRPKLLLGRFKAASDNWWREEEPMTYGAQWGGETGGYFLTNYLKLQNVTLYVDKMPTELIIKQRLHADPNGEIEILKRFWDFRLDLPRPDTVPPLLVYADLMATRDDRNIETATRIYEAHIARFVGKT